MPLSKAERGKRIREGLARRRQQEAMVPINARIKEIADRAPQKPEATDDEEFVRIFCACWKAYRRGSL